MVFQGLSMGVQDLGAGVQPRYSSSVLGFSSLVLGHPSSVSCCFSFSLELSYSGSVLFYLRSVLGFF